MSDRALPTAFLTLRGLDCCFCCCRLIRSAPNIPLKHTYRRELSALLPSVSPALPSVNPSGPPLDLCPNITNIWEASVDPPTNALSVGEHFVHAVIASIN